MSDRTAAIALLADGPLAIRESTLTAWCQALASDTGISAFQAQARTSTGARRNPAGTIGTFGFVGPIFHRPNVLTFLFGGTSIVEARRALVELLDESRVESIVIEFDTPGGGVDGLVEYAAELRGARRKKPILGLINTQCCSAGYWLAAQCTEVIATPSAEVGSVGVFMCHSDYSQMNERIGTSRRISARPDTKRKRIPTPHCQMTRGSICRQPSIGCTASSSPTLWPAVVAG